MYVNGNHTVVGGNASLSSESHLTFRNKRIHRNLLAGHKHIELTRCQTVGNMTTGSGAVNIRGGTLHGHVTTDGGEILIQAGAVVRGSLEAGNGDIRITGNSSVSAAGQTGPAMQTGSGNIHVTDATVSGQISSESGNIALNNATVEGNVTLTCNGVSIDGSTVAGTLTAVGDVLRIGDQSTIANLVLKLPPQVESPFWNRGSHTIVQINGMTSIDGGRAFFSGPGIAFAGGNIIGGSFNSASLAGRSGYRIDRQTILLGKGTKVENIKFEAARCNVVLERGAQYSGPRPEGMTIEYEQACPPRIAARECVAQIVRQTANPVVAAPPPPPRQASRPAPPAIPSPAAGSITLPPPTDFSTRAEAVRIRAMDAVFDTSIRGTGVRHARQEKMSDIGDQYVEGLQGPQARKVYQLISEMMTPEDKAKVLTSICYSTLVSADLDRDNRVCTRLRNLCKVSVDIADAVRKHIRKVDGAGIQGGLTTPVTGGFRMLKQPDGRLPYATQMMLDTLGIR